MRDRLIRLDFVYSSAATATSRAAALSLLQCRTVGSAKYVFVRVNRVAVAAMSAETPSGAAPEGRDEDFNYDVEYKSKCTGLGALLGAIRSQEDGEIFDDEDENAGGGGAGGSKKRKKTGRKRQHEDEQYYEQGKDYAFRKECRDCTIASC